MTRKKKYLLASIACLIVALGFFGYRFFSGDLAQGETGANSPVFKTLTPGEASTLIKTKNDLMIVDVRGPGELNEGWIEGTVLMPIPDILSGKAAPPKDRPILLVCAVGGRSLGLGQLIVRYGWMEGYNLEGGIANWKRQGLPLRYK